MACGGQAHPVYWVGIVVLCLAFALSLAGLASPYWREFDQIVKNKNTYRHSHEGLWQCQSQLDEDGCFGTDHTSGLWRVIQALEVVSIVCLFCGCLGSLICLKGAYRRAAKGCHSCAAAAVLTGAVFGLAGDMGYVGHVEVYSRPLAGDIPYSWSFALSVAGHISSLIAAVIILASAMCCRPKFSLQKARPYLEDYDLQKVGSGPLQYVYTLPVPLASPYYLADSSYWPNKGDFYKKGQPPSKDYYHRDFSQTWPAIKGDHPEKEKWPGKGDHHQKRVHVNGARVLEDDSMLSAKNSSGVGLSPLNKTTSTNIHEQSDSQDTVAIVSGQSQHRPIGGAQPHRGHAHQNDRTSPLRDPLQIDAANLKNLHKASYTVAAHGPVTEAAVSQTDRAIMDTSAGERLIWRPKATPPEYDRPMTGHPVLVRQHHVQEAPAYYTLPVKRFLYMPDTHNARARRPGTERVLIKAGGDTFLL